MHKQISQIKQFAIWNIPVEQVTLLNKVVLAELKSWHLKYLNVQLNIRKK